MTADDPHGTYDREDLRAVIDEEIDRLPSRYRMPVVLCYLEGMTGEAGGKAAQVSGGNTREPATPGARASALKPDAARAGADVRNHGESGQHDGTGGCASRIGGADHRRGRPSGRGAVACGGGLRGDRKTYHAVYEEHAHDQRILVRSGVSDDRVIASWGPVC